MPIGTGIIYNVGDLILSQVSGSGTSFLETKIAAATSSIVYFDSTARINSASLNSITVGTASYVSGSRSIITNLTASNISASGTGSFGIVGIGTTLPSEKLHVVGNGLITSGSAVDLRIDVSGTGNASLTIDRQTTGAESKILLLDGNVSQWGIAAKAASNNFVIRDADSTERFTILKSGGNVGIGTSSPASKLHISGSGQTIMRLDSDTTSSVSQFQIKAASDAVLIMGMLGGSAASTNFGVTAAGQAFIGTSTLGSPHPTSLVIGNVSNIPIAFSTNNTEKMRIASDGNVGIGTTSVSSNLHIYALTGPELRLSAGGTGTGGLRFLKGDSGVSYINNQDSYAMQFQIAGNTKMSILADGNVGIGTTTPGALLDVRGQVLVNNVTASVSKNQLTINTNGTNYAHFYDLGTIANTLVLGGSPSITTLPTASISASIMSWGLTSGNVGIGTTSPVGKLHVVGGGGSGALVIQGSGITSHFHYGTNEDTYIRPGKTVGAVFIADVGGNVGIGTTTTTAKLHVSGSTGGVFEVDTAGGTTSFYVSASGNVGIGTTVTVAKLQVAGAGIFASELLHNSSDQIGWVNAKFTDYNDGHGIYISSLQAGGGKWLSGEGRYWNSSFWRSTSTTSTAISLDSGALKFYTNSGLTANSDFQPSERMRINSAGLVGIGTTNPVATLQVAGNVSGSSFTSSISNAVGFLGTSSWASNAVTSLVCTGNAATATTASYANALNAANSYTVVDVNTTGNIRLRNGDPTITLSDTNDSSSFIHVDGNYFSILCGPPNASFGEWVVPANGRWPMEISLTNNTSTFGGSLDAISFIGSGSGLFGTAAGLSIGGTAATASYANALNAANSYTITGLTVNGNISASGTISASKLRVVGTANVIELAQSSIGSATYYVMDNTVETGGRRYRFGYSGGAADKGSFTIYNQTDNITPFTILTSGSVGIGTTAPGALLEISSSTASSLLNVKGAGGNGILFVSGSGFVGIGTTTPGAKLDVVGDLRVKSSGAAITLDTSATSDGRMEYKYNGTRKALIGVDSDNLQISADSGNYLQFRTNGSQRMIINNAGGVGIGTSNPNYAFDVYTNGSADALMSIRASGSANARIYFDAANGDLTGGDYCHLGQDKSTLNFVINTGGSAGNIHLQPKEGTNNGILFVSGSTRFGLVSTQNHQFTGSVSVSGSVTAASFTGSLSGSITSALTASYLTPANSYTITNLTASNISASLTGSFGYVGIGTSSPTQKLHIQNGYLLVDTNAAVGSGIWMPDTNGNPSLRIVTDQSSANFSSIVNNWGANTNAGIMVGTVRSDGTAFQVRSGVTVTSGFSNDDGTTRFIVNGDGNVGIGTAAPAAKLEISGSSNSVLLNIKSAISGAILYVSGSGAVGIGTSNVGAYTLQVSGSFAATTKSFVIEHPTKAGKKLIYGSLESPYHGIRLTGRDTLVNGKSKIQLPDYIYKLILHDSVNIQLTGIKCNKTLYIDDINVPENYFTIAYDKAIFESYKDYDFFWDFTAIRADVPELQTEM